MAPSLTSTGGSLIALQLFSRGLTFALNQALVRLTTPEALGTATIQMEVVLNTALFLAREGTRGALVRTAGPTIQSEGRRQQLVNAAFLTWPLGLASSVLVYALYYYSLDSRTVYQTHFHLTILLYLVATFVELAAEPMLIWSMIEGKTGSRVRVEGQAIIIKTLVTLGTVVKCGEGWALLSFALGQLGYALTLVIGAWRLGNAAGSDDSRAHRWPRRPTSPPKSDDIQTPWLNEEDTTLSLAMTRQSLVKQFLSEGDKMIVGRVCAIENQGGYAIALNYGSLVARVLFQPLEETARLHFSKTIGSSRSPDDQNPALADHNAKAYSSATILSMLLFLHAHLSLIFLAFGPPYVGTLLSILLGPRSPYLSPSSGALATLGAYCYLLPLLAFNGALEAFVQAVASPKSLERMGKWMVLWSGVFLASAALGTHFCKPKEVGMVYASAVNMACRIWWSWRFIRDWFHAARGTTHQGPKDAMWKQGEVAVQGLTDGKAWLPSKATAACFAVAAAIVRQSQAQRPIEGGLQSVVEHVAIGGVCGLVCVAVTWWTSRGQLGQFRSILQT